MKRFTRLGLILALAVLPLLVVTRTAHARGVNTGESVTIKEGETFSGTLFSAGKTLHIDGTIDGDVFCAGQNVTINGTVHGDVICAAQNLRISGVVDGNARLTGQTINIDGQIGRSLTVIAQSFTLEGKGSVANDLSAAGSDLSFRGPIGRDLSIRSGHATLSGMVGRNISAKIANISLTSGAIVGGDLSYTSTGEAVMDKNVVVTGTTRHFTPPPPRQSRFGSRLLWLVFIFTSMMLVSLTLAWLFPRLLTTSTDAAIKNPWNPGIAGFLFVSFGPVVFISFMLTIIGLSLGMLIALLYAVVLFVSGPTFGYYLGRRILPKSKQPMLIMLTGSAVLLFIYFIPIVGMIAVFIAMFFGSGIFVTEMYRLSRGRSQSKAK